MVGLPACRRNPEPLSDLWDGTEDADPEHDYNRLQGKWVQIDTQNRLIIHGHLATFEYPALRVEDLDIPRKFRFILNSERRPKAIRFHRRLDHGFVGEIPGGIPNGTADMRFSTRS